MSIPPGGLVKGVVAAALLFYALFGSTSWAGNKRMVEDRVRELDEVNKQMLQQVEDKPKDGTIEVKAKVTERQGRFNFDIYQKKVTSKENGELRFQDGATPAERRPGTAEGRFKFDAPQINKTPEQGEKGKDEDQIH